MYAAKPPETEMPLPKLMFASGPDSLKALSKESNILPLNSEPVCVQSKVL